MSNTKLSPHTTWLFAFGSVLVATGLTYAMAGLGTKVTAAVYFGVVALGGFLSTYLTRARVAGAVVAFLAVAAIAAAGYFVLVDHLFRTATSVATDAVSGGAAHAQGADAGATMGKFFGIFVAVVVFVETLVAGIGGAACGNAARSGGLAQLQQRSAA
jgi:hypothetical protein